MAQAYMGLVSDTLGERNAVALGAYDVLDDDELERLLAVLTPLAKAVVRTGDIPAATPMGPTLT